MALWAVVDGRGATPDAGGAADRLDIFNVVKLPAPLARVESASLPRTSPANPVLPVAADCWPAQRKGISQA